MSLCKDTIFCLNEVNNRPYIINYQHLDKNISYEDNYKKYEKLIDDIIKKKITNTELIKDKLINLYTNPENIQKIKYIFIGNVEDKSIIDLLNKFEKNKKLNKTEIKLLDDYFNYNVLSEWKIDTTMENVNTEIKFIYRIICGDDTIKYMINMIVLYCSDLYNEFSNENIYLYNNKETDWGTIEKKIIYTFKENNEQNKNLDIEKYLKSYLVPNKIIKEVLSEYDNPDKNIEEIIKNKLIRVFIDNYNRFKPLTYEFYNKYIQYPIDSYIFNYWNKESDIYIDDIEKDINIDYLITNNTISYITDDNNEFYMYNFNSIIKNLMNQNKYSVNQLSGEIFKNYYKYFLGKLFYNIKQKDYEQNINKKESSIKELKNIYDKRDLIMNIYNNFKDEDINKNIKIVFNKIYYGIIGHNILGYKLKLPIEIKNIFNELKLSLDIPFVKFRDLNSKEMMYKIYKPITQKENNDYTSIVPIELLDSWIKYSNYKFENGKLTEYTLQPKELLYKLFFYKKEIGEVLRGKIYKLNDDNTCDVMYNDYVYNYVNYTLVNKKNNEFAKLNDEVYFRKYERLYLDVELFKNGEMNITFKLDDFNFEEIYFGNILGIITDKINNFITELYQIDSLRIYDDYINYVNLDSLKYDRHLSNSKFENLIYKYDVIIPKDIPISYNELNNIRNLCNQFILANDKPLLKDEHVEYFDNNLNEWVGCKIVDFSYDGLYKIKLDYIIKGQEQILNEVSRALLRSKSDEERKGVYEIIYKRKPKFDKIEPMKQLIIQYNKSGLSELMIRSNLKEMFELTDEEVNQYITDIQRKESISELDKLDAELGISIAIDYTGEDIKTNSNKLNIYIQNVSSLEYIPVIYKFITFFFTLYIDNITNNKNSKLYPIIKNQINELDIKKEEDLLNEIYGNNINNKKIESFDDLDINDLFNDDDDFLDFDITDSNDEIKKVDIYDEELRFKKIMAERKLELSSSQDGRTENNPILKKLYNTDAKLFNWKEVVDKKEKSYYSTCQGINRYPKVLTDEEKEQIDLEHPGSYSLDPKNKDTCENNDDIKKNMKKNNNKIKCNAIKWGTTETNKNWYICPRIYDILEGTPINISDLKFDKDQPQFISKNIGSITDWRTDKDTGRDILTFNPTYKGRKLIEDIESYSVNKNKTVLILKKGIEYAYPGFQKSPTVPVIYSPCCFTTTSMRAKEAFLLTSDDETKKSNDYIQTWGRTLESNPPRIGLLAPKLYEFLDINPNNCINGDLTEDKKCFFRRGIKQDKNSFLSLIANIKDDNWTDENIIRNIMRNLTPEEFITLNNGNLEIQFSGVSSQSGYQNYLEYLISDSVKNYKFFYDYLTKPNKWLFEHGIELIIIEVYTEGDEEYFKILCPYFISNRKIDKDNTPIVLALKENNTYEPIYYFDGNSIARKKFNLEDKRLENIYNLYKKNCQTIIPSKLINLANSKNKLLFDKKYTLNETINILNRLDFSYQPKLLIRDDYNKIVSIFLNNNLFVPVYPENSSETNIKIMQYNEIIDNYLLDLYETLKKYDELYIRSGKRIEILPFKYFYDNKKNIIGILTNIGIYIPVKPTQYYEKEVNKLINYLEIDKNIRKFQIDKENLVFKSKNKIEEVEEILGNLYKKYKDAKFLINKYILNGNNIVAILINNDIIIPIESIEKIKFNKKNAEFINQDEFKIDNYEKYINNSFEIGRLSDYKIKCLVFGGIFEDNTHKYIGLKIESNFNIYFEESEVFLINDKDEVDYKILKLIENKLITKALNNNIFLNENNNLFMDKRILSVKKLNYNKNMYEILKYELHLFLHKKFNKEVLNFITKILNLNIISSSQKKYILLPIFNLLFNSFIKIKSDDYNNYPTVNKFLTCNTANGCNNNSNCIREAITTGKKINNLDNYISQSINIKYDKKYFGNTLLSFFENAHKLYNKLIDTLNGEIYCKTKLSDTIDNLLLNSIKNKIIEECIKNNFIRNQILKTYTRTIKEDKYTLFPDVELLLNKEDIDSMGLTSYYEAERKEFFEKIDLFEEVDTSKTIGGIVIKTNIESKDKCEVGKIMNHKIKFLINKKQNLNTSKITNKLLLDEIQYKLLSDKINRLNLVLTNYEIGKVKNYNIKIIKNKTKRLK